MTEPAPSPSAGSLARRNVPDTPLEVSVLGWSVDPAGRAGPVAERSRVELLRRAYHDGVNLFATIESPQPEIAERLLALAFPAPAPDLVVVVPYPGLRASAGELERAVERLRTRFGTATRLVVEADVARLTEDQRPSTLETLESLRQAQRIAAWAVRSPAGTRAPDRTLGARPALESVAASLLSPGPLSTAAGPESGAGSAYLVRDPFAEGRLDGTRFAPDLAHRPPAGGPWNLRMLHREFEPVLRLGFLTRERHRTLAQAAIRYLLDRPGVVSVLLPEPRADRWEEYREGPRVPELSHEELRRLSGDAIEPRSSSAPVR